MQHASIPNDVSKLETTALSLTNNSSPDKISTSINNSTKNLKCTSQQTAPNVADYSQIPYNSARPPPYAYQRQHDFPPFPPFTRHPVLPFLTTAFADQRSEPPQTTKHRTLSMKRSAGQQNVQNHISTIPTMDVSKNDPAAIFIHPPFVVPISPGETTSGSANDPSTGMFLTYAIMHNHRDWFLDPDDFGKDSPNRIDYPAELEPPRGWAPLDECLNTGAIKKQKEKLNTALRTKGSYVTPELLGIIEYGPSDDCHELTVLRCTFCRREYHGPNAKSMWRRHVYDKHKVAMKNRREGSAGSAIRNVPKKPKSKSSPQSFDMPSPNDPPSNFLDCNSEENIIRLLEHVISGDLHLDLPDYVSSSNTINLQTIFNTLQRSNPIMNLNDSNLEIPSSSLLQFTTSSRSTDSKEQRISVTKSSSNESSEDPESPESLRLQNRKTEVSDNAESSFPSERTPLKDNTFADRSYHNSAVTASGTPRKEKTKQQKTISKSPIVRVGQITPTSSPQSFNSYSHHHSLTSAALRARALATTGEESYLTLLVSSPSIAANSPFKSLASPSTNRLSPFSNVKRRESDTTSDDLGIPIIPSFRFPFIDFNVEASNNPVFSSALTSDPVEVDAKRLLPLSAGLAPPALVDEKLSRFASSSRASKAGVRGRKQDVPTVKQDLTCSESPLQRLQRRGFNKNDDQSHDDDFDMEYFLNLKDAENLFNQSSSPLTIPLPCGFAKEFGLLSQEEVDRITTSLRPAFGEDLRYPKRRRIDLSS